MTQSDRPAEPKQPRSEHIHSSDDHSSASARLYESSTAMAQLRPGSTQSFNPAQLGLPTAQELMGHMLASELKQLTAALFSPSQGQKAQDTTTKQHSIITDNGNSQIVHRKPAPPGPSHDGKETGTVDKSRPHENVHDSVHAPKSTAEPGTHDGCFGPISKPAGPEHAPKSTDKFDKSQPSSRFDEMKIERYVPHRPLYDASPDKHKTS